SPVLGIILVLFITAIIGVYLSERSTGNVVDLSVKGIRNPVSDDGDSSRQCPAVTGCPTLSFSGKGGNFYTYNVARDDALHTCNSEISKTDRACIANTALESKTCTDAGCVYAGKATASNSCKITGCTYYGTSTATPYPNAGAQGPGAAGTPMDKTLEEDEKYTWVCDYSGFFGGYSPTCTPN
ncbi:MAG: hypothetical protein AABY11_04065, partial [archaeon]